MLSALHEPSLAEMGQVRIAETVDEVYEYFVDRLHMGQAAIIPYKTLRSQKDKPKCMTDRLRNYIGQKISIYRRLRGGDEVLRAQFNKLARTVSMLTAIWQHSP